MPSHRIERLNKDFRKELSSVISGMKDPRLDEFLSVMRVEVTTDLSYAKAYIGSIHGGDAAREAVTVLAGAEGHIKTELSKRLKIRKIPEISFIADDSVDYYNKINSILEGLKNGQDD